MQNYTQDYLLNKRVKIFQPVDGYRASTDAIILSALISKVKVGDKILDIGSGTGAISLCLAERFKDKNVNITGLELQAELAELSNLSAAENSFNNFLTYLNCNINAKLPLENCSFNHVITNPPYSESDMPSPNQSKSLAHNHSDLSLSEWIKFCIKMLAPKGFFYMINRAEAIDYILHEIHNKLGNIKIIPLYSKEGQDAKRVMIIAQKDSKAATQILPALTVHNEDGEYSLKAFEILREGKSFLS